MKNVVKLLSVLMVLCMLLSSCSQGIVEVANAIIDTPEENGAVNSVISNSEITNVPSPEQDKAENLSATTNTNNAIPEAGTYNEGVVLVKYDGEFTENVLAQLDFVSAEPLYMGSSWHTVTLGESMDTVEAVEYLTELGCFEKVDYDYIMGVTADTASAEVSGNPNYASQKNHGVHKIPEGWEEVKKNGKHPGGSPDVVIAIIDTGVDYNHLDLRNNIWVNPAEIPDNGIDDDNNGYVDDINGWDCVGDDNDPMDDNGHGTHVAGIIAAENNKIGGVGVAYNCKIMVLKAGSSSGYFNNSDIAEAIQYAYMNGASVINMSFGGASISASVEETLEDAYNQCVLVAAAGNSGLCNQPGCTTHALQPPTPCYPASLQYVIGVMSCDATGSSFSKFSNFDHYPYNNYEYDVVACGENIQSTWPNNKYASLSGTSMACPTVAGIAAVLRSTFSDRETYSTKYITAQIVSTVSRANNLGIANLYKALTELPKPCIYSMYDQYIFDNVEFSPKNNGNGIIDAGETIRLAFELQNRGGMATNVVAKIDTIRNDDPDLTDPYFTITKDTVNLSDIGTYSIRDFGKIYDEDGNWVGTEKYFEIVVSENCPNAYLVNFNLHVTYKNGLNANDDATYEGVGSIFCNVNRGYHLSGVISEDTVFEADRLYIVSSDVIIPEGVTVKFKEGCEIQFYDNREYYNSPIIQVYGTLNFEGTKEKMIKLAPDDHHEFFVCRILLENSGALIANYLDAVNLEVEHSKRLLGYANIEADVSFNHSYLKQNALISEGWATPTLLKYLSAEERHVDITLIASRFENCYIEAVVGGTQIGCVEKISGSFVKIDSNNGSLIKADSLAVNNIFCSGDFDDLTASAGRYMFGDSSCLDPIVQNNIFYSMDDTSLKELAPIDKYEGNSATINFIQNAFSKGYQRFASQFIDGYYDASGNPIVDVYGSLADASLLWPHVVTVEIFNKDGEKITTIGKEEIKLRVTFNRPMDTTKEVYAYFGSVLPYADYRIDGEFISDTVWEGTYTLKAQIENGRNFIKVMGACDAEDETMVVYGEYQLHEFTIDTTAAMSMNLLANPLENGIELTFAQDDYDTLLGYNIYRSEEKDGNFVKLNPAILLPSDSTFIDENAEPGKTYWYTYTVVLTDFSESNPAGKVQATAKDTMAPNMYHTPVNQGYLNNNLVISCTASDNVGIKSVVLYYRAVGAAEWKTLTMVKQNDKFSATIFGSDLTLDGIEYYIVAYDANNSIAKGSAEAPYKVVIKDASAISRKGDVDGDGTVTTKDALMLMQCINGDLILSDDEFKRADLNGDGTLNSSEALRILQYINGKVSTLEM